MPVIDEIRAKVTSIAQERGMVDNHAFGYWFLEDIEGLSQELAEATVTGGPWDGGRDAVYLNEEISELRIYQMKYSENRAYVLGAFGELQNGLIAEYNEHPESFENLNSLKLAVVTTLRAENDFEDIKRQQQRRIRTWLTRHGLNNLSRETYIEVFDLHKFAQLMERLYGIDLNLVYREAPIRIDNNLFGLIDARGITAYIGNDELLAFNIRNFLGIRVGSVNSNIKDTLENDKNSFWQYNNGIVCLCTDSSPVDNDTSRVHFSDFTIVNGAQTISTTAKFLEDNPAEQDEPIWVVSKIIKVDANDLEMAIKLTVSSNTQNSVSNKDLRAVDRVHVTLRDWFQDLGVTYIYRRGDRANAGEDVIQMKDLVQAYVAFWLGFPQISFARAGSVFNTELYERIFERNRVNELKERENSEDEILRFTQTRLLPVRLLGDIRTYVNQRVNQGANRKWKSLAYHILFVYKALLETYLPAHLNLILDHYQHIIQTSIPRVFDGFTQLAQLANYDIPRDLKSEIFKEAIETRWLLSDTGQEVRNAIRQCVDAYLEVENG